MAIVNATRLRGTDWETICAAQSIMRDLGVIYGNLAACFINIIYTDQLTGESTKLRESIAALLCTLPPESSLASALEGLLLVLDMRLENLTLSKSLLATIRDNAKNLQHLDNLRVLVEVEKSDDPDM